MFGGEYYSWDITRKMVITFGSIFNDTKVKRVDENGVEKDFIKVPLTFAPKDKMITRFKADPNIDRPFSVNLPAMSFEISNIQPDFTRKLPQLNKIVAQSSNPDKAKRIFTNVPYIINFTLYVYAKNYDDGNKIVEQILPFFPPAWNASVEFIPEMNIYHDVVVELGGITTEDTYSEDFKNRRLLIWTFNFTMKTFFYGPVQEKPIIKFAIIDYGADANSYYQRVTTTPGLLANGSPTTNSSLSVNVHTISLSDDFGYCFDRENLL